MYEYVSLSQSGEVMPVSTRELLKSMSPHDSEPPRLPATSDERAGVCRRCKGKKYVVSDSPRGSGWYVKELCPDCGGTGKHD